MALPMNNAPVYSLTIPSTKQKWQYRPFLVKDEKALLIAQQSEQPEVMLETIKSVIVSCSKTPIDAETLASFDIEYMFTQLRARSVGELVELTFACDVCTDEKARVKLTINLDELKVEVPEGHTKKIPLFGDVGVMMKYPTMDTLKKIETSTDDTLDELFDIITDCIDYIYDSEQIYPAKEQSKKELLEFIDNLTKEQFETLQGFFTTMPSLKHYIKYTCPVCGREHNKYLEGLSSFF